MIFHLRVDRQHIRRSNGAVTSGPPSSFIPCKDTIKGHFGVTEPLKALDRGQEAISGRHLIDFCIKMEAFLPF